MKEVYFYKYCSKCKNSDIPETEDPCNECLLESSREESRKPIKYVAVDAEPTKTRKIHSL